MNREEIINSLKSYDSNFNEEKINKAIDFVIHYHGSQLRESGEPYYKHPLEVAGIIIALKLDSNAVITALLHDTVEDTELTLEDIKNHFGEEVAKLVDGVTKLSKIEFIPDHVRQAENFRKLLLAMSQDIRVLLIKLADRLHNMRTLEFVKSQDKRMRVALETMEIYAPLAERIGAQQIKTELQDLSFQVLHPEIRESILSSLKNLAKNEKVFINNIVKEIEELIFSEGIKAKIYGRGKTPYSIWMKMHQKKISLEQLSDITAFRIIVDTIKDCYQALGIIHTTYKMVPENFQDFISTPKNNGYQSLHTVVIGPLQQKIEIQIRTNEMHQVAELGVASHWIYKQHYNQQEDPEKGLQYSWIRELLSISEHATDAEDFLYNTKLAMYYDQVFCFTPKGNLIALPRNATCVDFAYAVHSNVGHHCVGSKVNGRLVPLKTTLKNGDQVQIITSNAQVPSGEWEKFVVTGKARAEIKKFTRGQRKSQYNQLGKIILEKALKSASINDYVKALNDACRIFKKKTPEDLYYAISDGLISREEIVKELTPKKSNFSKTLSLLNFKYKDPTINKNEPIPIKGLVSGMVIHFAGCCHPLPGDKIVGIIHTGSGVTVHTSDCNMVNNFTNIPGKVLELTWDSDKTDVPFISRLEVVMENKAGSLAMFTNDLAKDQINIINLKILGRNLDFFHFYIDVEVDNLREIDDIIKYFQSKKSIYNIERMKI